MGPRKQRAIQYERRAWTRRISPRPCASSSSQPRTWILGCGSAQEMVSSSGHYVHCIAPGSVACRKCAAAMLNPRRWGMQILPQQIARNLLLITALAVVLMCHFTYLQGIQCWLAEERVRWWCPGRSMANSFRWPSRLDCKSEFNYDIRICFLSVVFIQHLCCHATGNKVNLYVLCASG